MRPLFHVLADVGEWADAEALHTASSDPLRVEGLALRRGGGARQLLANLSPARQRVRVALPAPGAPARIRRLDAATADVATRDPDGFRATEGERADARGGALLVELAPHACARVDVPA